MAQQPAVVIVARHGARLDAADARWHLSTPTPYDPPLTYGGWKQCRTLGARIANLLDAREQRLNAVGHEDGVIAHDFAQLNGNGERHDTGSADGARKRRKVRHKVVIHSSPFLRCLQTSVAIAAGMAEHKPTVESAKKTTSKLHSASPRLAPMSEPQHDLANAVARSVLHAHKRHRKSKLRVDAFLGEWLCPQYFDQITPPPPSGMMLKAAHAELMQHENVDIFTPSNSTSSNLWAGADGTRSASKESTLDDWSGVRDSLPLSPSSSAPSRSRSNSQSNVGASESGRKSPFRPGAALQPLTSTLPKQEASIYHPPTPQYAVSSSDKVPRGYVAHARNACTDVDYQWDSSRPQLSWGDGGEYGEEWPSMHKRLRKGLGELVAWYGQHDVDDRGEDALGFDQAEHRNDGEEEQEDLVVVIVTHGAGCNALIGALTEQPVLLDVGLASLTMAVRKDDLPASSVNGAADAEDVLNGHQDVTRRVSSTDPGLSSLYELQITASTEHLRAGADLSRVPSRTGRPADLHPIHPSTATHAAAGVSLKPHWNLGGPARSSTNSSLGTIRRPPHAALAAPSTSEQRSNSTPPGERFTPPSPGYGSGLWTPPPSAARTPVMQPQPQRDAMLTFPSLDENGDRTSPGRDMVLDFSTSPPDSRPGTSHGAEAVKPISIEEALRAQLDGASDEKPAKVADGVHPLASAAQKGLWPSKPKVEKLVGEARKRRWTVDQNT